MHAAGASKNPWICPFRTAPLLAPTDSIAEPFPVCPAVGPWIVKPARSIVTLLAVT
jgi:hypothetical protein